MRLVRIDRFKLYTAWSCAGTAYDAGVVEVAMVVP